MKHQVFQEYSKRRRLALKFKLNGKDKIKAIKHKGCYSYMVWGWNHKFVDDSELKN